MAKSVTYEARPGWTYSGTYVIKHGMAYVTAQGHTGTPVTIGGSSELDAATWALRDMVGKFKLAPDATSHEAAE